jgi:probable F420-dependent oxidoreductase
MLEFGIAAVSADSATAWRELARQAEGAGFDTLYVPDHLGLFDPFPALVAAASATERVRVGTYVLNIQFWNPLLLARAAMTTHLLSDGRLVIGIGAGHAEIEFHQAGLRYPSDAERVRQLERVVPVLRRLLDGETVDDAFLRLRGAATGLVKTERPIPILIGGRRRGDLVRQRSRAALHSRRRGWRGARQRRRRPGLLCVHARRR